MNNGHFELLKEQAIPELNTQAKLYRHRETGAQLLSMINDDENKVFGITFRTPPPDSTGLPHILEHSVLCGSRKYPLKEPFIELAKGSLNTFLNAFTYPDKTCYPVASQNLQDFYNLIDVYLDAVFYPRITPHVLQQEGWHYELKNKDEPMIYKGVVFNEMKGAYSSPESLMFRQVRHVLFPDTPYGVDSGGDPKVIPTLTYEQFKQFHETYYHPSNSFIYFYGDDNPEKRFELVQNYLQDFQHQEVEATINLQSRFEQPQRLSYPYAASQEDVAEQKSMLTVNWLLPPNNEQNLRQALGTLSHALLRTPASPLRKALLDSGLGEDVIGGGLAGHLRQMYFSAGLKGIKLADADKVEQLIFDTLTEIVEQGFDPATLEAALNTIEFRLREYNTGGSPRGLSLMVSALATWIHGYDPIEEISFEARLQAIKEHYAQDNRFFEKLIQEHLLDNRHRVTIVLEPDGELKQRQEAEEAARLADIKAQMSDQELARVIEETQLLRELQDKPDPPEVLAMVPSLTLADIDKENKTLPLEVIPENGHEILYHDLFTSGIVYLEVGFNLRVLPQELLPYISLFSDALFEIGTETEDYVKLSQRIGRKTGGMRAFPMISSQPDSPESVTWLFLRGKSTVAQTEEMLAIMRDVLLTVKLDNQERFKQLVLEDKAQQETSLIPGGHRVVATRLKANFHETGWLNEQLGGVDYLFFLRQLAHDVQHNWPDVLAKLEQIRQILINRNALVCNVTLDADNWQQVQPQVQQFIAELPARPYQPATWTWQPGVGFEGLTAAAAQVNYVGKAANIYDLGYQFHGSLSVISNYLRTTYLWEKIRMQGGAYGAFCSFDRNTGVFSYLSYRDPNLLETLTNYDRASEFLRQLQLNEDQLTKSIIGVIGDIDAYRLPDAKGYASMVRYLINYTEEAHQQFRDEVLSTTPAHFAAFAEVLEQFNQHGVVTVFSSPEKIEAINQQRGGQWLTITPVK